MATIPLLAISDRQDLYSMAYVRAVVATAGFNFSTPEIDRNSDDVHIEHRQEEGFVPAYSRLIIQVKCTYAHTVANDEAIHYPLPIRNYNHLRLEQIEPRILVVVLVPRPDSSPPEPWIECLNQHTILRYRAYWTSLIGAKPVSDQETVTVKIPTTKPFDVEAVRHLERIPS